MLEDWLEAWERQINNKTKIYISDSKDFAFNAPKALCEELLRPKRRDFSRGYFHPTKGYRGSHKLTKGKSR